MDERLTSRAGVVLVEDFYTNAHSSRKPGFGPGAARGAGGATTATGIGADVVMGTRDAERDARQAARAIAKELAGFFARQGGISQDQAERWRLIP